MTSSTAAITTLEQSLTDKRKAILQRFLIEQVCGRKAAQVFYGKLFSRNENVFDKPLSFNVGILSHWSFNVSNLVSKMNSDIITNRLSQLTDSLAYKPVMGTDMMAVDTLKILHPNRFMTNNSSLVFSHLDDFEFMSYSVEEDSDMYSLADNNTIRNKWEDVYYQITNIKIAKTEFPGLHLYQIGYDKIINTAVTRLYSGLGIEVMIESEDLNSIVTEDAITSLRTDITILSKQMMADVPKLKVTLDSAPFYVYRGGAQPVINSSVDIFTATLPIIYECTYFFSTTCDYAVANRFLETPDARGAKVMWKLRVATCRFACLGKTDGGLSDMEKEFLFGYGQRIEITSISMSEDGLPIVNGTLLDFVEPSIPEPSIPEPSIQYGGYSDGTAYLYPMSKRPGISDGDAKLNAKTKTIAPTPITDDRPPDDAIDKILIINEDRKGTNDSPYLLFFEHDYYEPDASSREDGSDSDNSE